MTQYIANLDNLQKSFGHKSLFTGIDLSFIPGAKIGIVGVNGSGKSSLLKIMAGIDQDYSGTVWVAPEIKIGYLEQEPKLDPSKNVRENVLAALAQKQELLTRYNAISARFAEDLDPDEMDKLIAEQAELQEQIEQEQAWDLEREITIAMDALRCPDGDAKIDEISGGELRRVALCKLILEKPDMLLLDEPTNHLDAESVAWLERYLQEYTGMVIMVTHDRYFLDNITGWILELDRGQGIPWQGNYASWLAQKSARLLQEEKQESSRYKQLSKELEWVKQTPKARSAKNKARVKSYDSLVAQDRRISQNVATIVIPEGPRLGNQVLVMKNLRKEQGQCVLIEDLSFSLQPGSIVGIIGPNGAGKSTLFKLIAGLEQPSAGELLLGETVQLSYVDQHRSNLNPENTVWQEISAGLDIMLLGKDEVNSRAYCSTFNFKGPDQQKKIAALSGGERNRLHLAKMLATAGNVMLLDEPTNDLDVDTLRALEAALLNYAGCALVISHDRWFLDRVATHILAFTGDGQVEFFAGNYSDYREQFAKQTEMKKFRYKKIT